MNHSTGSITADRVQLDLIHRLAAYVSWALAGAIFLTIGWVALEPVDPLGPVSLLSGRGAISMLVQAAALAVVASAVATVLVGDRLPDIGVFAAALGLFAVSLRGHTMEYLLLLNLERGAGTSRLIAQLILETVGWSMVMAVSTLTSGLVQQWLDYSRRDGGKRSEVAHPFGSDFALADIPFFGSLLIGSQKWPPTELITGLKHSGIATVSGLLAFRLLSSGLYERVIQHGQACFMVAVAVAIGSYIAARLAPVRTAAWGLLASVLIAVVGYTIAIFTAPGSAVGEATSYLPPNIPASHFLRVLPIQYIGVGSATAVAMWWYMRLPEPNVEVAPHAAV